MASHSARTMGTFTNMLLARTPKRARRSKARKSVQYVDLASGRAASAPAWSVGSGEAEIVSTRRATPSRMTKARYRVPRTLD